MQAGSLRFSRAILKFNEAHFFAVEPICAQQYAVALAVAVTVEVAVALAESRAVVAVVAAVAVVVAVAVAVAVAAAMAGTEAAASAVVEVVAPAAAAAAVAITRVGFYRAHVNSQASPHWFNSGRLNSTCPRRHSSARLDTARPTWIQHTRHIWVPAEPTCIQYDPPEFNRAHAGSAKPADLQKGPA